jgi:hypothetical protein
LLRLIWPATGVNVACDGSVAFRERERIPFDWLLATKQVGEHFNVGILRDGIQTQVSVQLQTHAQLVNVQHYDRPASYFIYAGLVFIKLTQPFLHEWGQDWYNEAPRKLSDRAMNGEMEDPNQEVVVLSSVLADEINIGYADCVNTVLTKVNGVKVLNLDHGSCDDLRFVSYSSCLPWNHWYCGGLTLTVCVSIHFVF